MKSYPAVSTTALWVSSIGMRTSSGKCAPATHREVLSLAISQPQHGSNNIPSHRAFPQTSQYRYPALQPTPSAISPSPKVCLPQSSWCHHIPNRETVCSIPSAHTRALSHCTTMWQQPAIVHPPNLLPVCPVQWTSFGLENLQPLPFSKFNFTFSNEICTPALEMDGRGGSLPSMISWDSLQSQGA